MEHDLVLEGRVVTSAGLLDTEVGVSEGIIRQVGRGLKGSRRIRAGDCLIFPGFIDIHVHMREPGWEHKEDYRTGTEAAAHGGVTTVVDMPNNPTPANTKETIDAKRRLASGKALVRMEMNGGVNPGDLGSLGEMAPVVAGYKIYLSETTGAGAFPASQLGACLGVIAATKKPVSLHCEDQGVVDEMRGKLAGVEGPDIHCDLRPPRAETEAVARVVNALRAARGVRANVCHASTAETLGMVRSARAEGLQLFCEATLHHLFFSRRAMLSNPLLKANPPLRSEEDRGALLRGVRTGEVSFLVTDHAPHTLEEKRAGAAGVTGLDDYAHVATWLIRREGVEPSTISKVACANPALFLGLRDRGSVAAGMRADFTVIDLHAPETVNGEALRTKCGWSPYEGREFPGRARWTIVGGEPVLDECEIVR